MIATNLIKINGVWYHAGDELPDDRTPTLKPVFDDVDKPKVEIPKEPPKENKTTLTREDIKNMKYFSLKSIAEKNGIVVKGKKQPVLQKEVIEALGL